jgi:Lon protease-like protein
LGALAAILYIGLKYLANVQKVKLRLSTGCMWELLLVTCAARPADAHEQRTYNAEPSQTLYSLLCLLSQTLEARTRAEQLRIEERIELLMRILTKVHREHVPAS